MNAPRVAVIGGGLAGLAAALRLASRGAEVTLFERRADLGGKAGEFRHQGFRFDTGPTVVTLPDVVEGAFADAGVGQAPVMEELDPLCRYRFATGRVWDVGRDAERTAAQLPEAQARSYRTLLEEARVLFEGAAPTFVHGPKPGALALLRYALRHGARAHPFRTLPGLVRRLGADRELEAFFLRFATYAGADPYRAPAVLLNIAWAELGLGTVSMKGGVHALVRALAEAAERSGARLLTGAGVDAVDVEDGRIRAVRAGGRRWDVDAVVSAADIEVGRRLLGRPAAGRVAPPSLSGFVLLLGVAGREPSGAHHTVIFPRDYAAEFAALRAGRLAAEPTLYLSVSARSDPSDAPEGHENWFVMVNAPPLPEAPTADPLASALPGGGRTPFAGPPLLDLDGEVASAAERRYAGWVVEELRRRSDFDPARLRFWRFVGPRQLARLGDRGAIYGAAPLGLTGALRPAPRLPGVANLALAGGTVHPGGGIPLVLLSGRNAADSVLAGAAKARPGVGSSLEAGPGAV